MPNDDSGYFFEICLKRIILESTIEILGGYGIIQEYGAEKIYRDAVSAISGGGTNEIQRVIVANDTIKNLFDIRKKEDV